MRHTTAFKLMPLLLLLLSFSMPLSAQDDEESDFNWNPGGNSLQWFDPTNWNAGDEDGPTPGGTEAVVNIGAGNPAFYNSTGGGGGILLLNIGNNARLDIETGFLSFGPRTAARPFSMQNSGVLNVTGSTAEIRLRDTVANFSPASINLDNGGRIRIVDGDTTINTSNLNTGNGLITLGANTEISGSGGAILTIEKQTIQGQGNIGANSIGLRFDENTIVEANVAGASLTVDAAAGLGLVNENVIRATNGGILNVRGAVTNTGGLIEAEDGSAVTLSDTFDITGGILRRSGTGTFTSSGSGRLANLTLDDTTIEVLNAGNLSLVGAIENSGDIAITNINSATDLQIDDSAVLTGGGTITLGGVFSSVSRITDDNGGGILTNVDNTIQGKGLVGNGLVQINNTVGGTIAANDSSGSLTLGPVSGAALVNRGLLTASSGGNLVFGAGEYDNAGGTIDLQDDSTITLNSGSNITGGTVQNLGTGSFDIAGTGSLTDLTTNGTINVNNGENLKLTGTINNLGDITVTNSNTATDIQIDSAASLTGGGTVTLGGVFGTSSRITDDIGSDGVLTNVDNSIRGKGVLGDGRVQIINEAGGTLDGNDDTGALVVGGVSTSTSINRGLITASNGGSLTIASGEFDNSAGLVESQSGSQITVGGTSVLNGGIFNAKDDSKINFGGSGQVVGATLRSEGSGEYEAIAGTSVLENVTNESSITVTNGANLGLVGTIDNSGDIAAENTNTATDIQIDDAVSLTGGGTVTLGGVFTTASRITDDDGGGELTNVDNTIRGKGLVGAGLVKITNETGGTIDANDSTGSLTVSSASGSALVNRGLLTASNGGNLVLGAGEYDNAGGTIDIQDDSTITFNSGSNVTGGTVQNLGTGGFDMANTGSFTDLTTIGTINVNNGGNLKLTGAISNLGDITVTNTNVATDIQIDSAAILTGGGTVTLGGVFSTASRITDDIDGDGVLTNVDNTIRGKGLVGDGRVQIINEVGGTIDANDSTGALTLGPVSGSAFVNRGLMKASNEGNLIFGGGEFDNAGGLVQIQGDSTITLNNGSNITGGTVENLGAGRFAISGTGSLTALTTKGAVDVDNGENLRLTGEINNLGDITVTNTNTATDIQIDTSATLTGGGTVTLGGVFGTSSRITDDIGGDGVLTNVDNTIRGKGLVGNGQVHIDNLVQGVILADQSGESLIVNSSAPTFDNFGTLAAENNSNLDILGVTNNFGIVDAEAGSTIRFGNLVNDLGGQLVGDGVIEAADEIINNGTISPGNSPGLLTLDADLGLGSSSRLEFELASMLSFDELIVNGELGLGGSLELALLDGYTPGETDIFDIVLADAITGLFDNVSDGGRLLTTDGLGSFQVNYGSGGSVQLSAFSAVPEPGSATILIAACLGMLVRRRRV